MLNKVFANMHIRFSLKHKKIEGQREYCEDKGVWDSDVVCGETKFWLSIEVLRKTHRYLNFEPASIHTLCV